MQLSIESVPVKAKLIKKTRLDQPLLSTRAVYSLDFHIEEKINFRGGDLIFIPAVCLDNKLRPYSIGSSSVNGSVVKLTIGLQIHSRGNGEIIYNTGCDYLLNYLHEGSVIDAYIHSHPNFNLPQEGNEPFIMVATGTGIAPFLGLLEDAKEQGRKAWLFWGNGHSEGDQYYTDLWAKYQKNHVLSHVNLIYDNEERGYVQDELCLYGEIVFEWLNNKNALLFMCGRRQTVGDGVEQALKTIYQQQTKSDEQSAMIWLNHLYQKQQIRADLFG